MRTVRVALVAALFLALQPAAEARQDQPPRSPRNASYTLQATLDAVNRLIVGRGRLTWRNISANPATELRFHLYWNAWRDPSSTWLREQSLGRSPRLALRPDDDRGFIDLTGLRLGAETDLLPRARFIAPDDGNADDRTVLAVPLDAPVAPGQTIEIDLAWTARVPRTYARTGVLGNYFFIAQWFPKIGVLEDQGWNCHQFHAATEFFADFGAYDVSLTVPQGWIVGATGREQSVVDEKSGLATHRFVETDVHDFAWTTSPDFVVYDDQFAEPGLPKVSLRLLLQPEHADQAARHVSAARAVFRHYSTWFGFYPYDHLTIVDPVPIVTSSQGESTGGMEYPTLITAGTRWMVPKYGTQPESVTVHETGHQFWYGVVATNETEHAWMDEGLNTFASARAMAEAFGPRFAYVERYFGGLVPWTYHGVAWTRDIDGNRMNAFRPVARADVPSTPTFRYWPGSASQISYNKTALSLATLERLLGWPVLQKILATHYARGVFRHPSPEEFFAIANEVYVTTRTSGAADSQDLTWFFDAVYRSSAVFDYGVAQVTTLDRTEAPAAAGARRTADHTVIVRRFGDGVFPIDVRVVFDDGAVVTERWDGRDQWHAFRFRRGARVATVEVDPDRVLLLDVNATNNSWSARPKAAEASRAWALRWLTWLEEVMLTYAFFA